MKKIKRILLVAFLAISTFSCDDALEIVQDGEINNDASFQTVANLRQFLIGDIYSRVNNTNEIDFTSIFTDEVGIGPNNGGQGLQLHRYLFNANSGNASSLWITHYGIINRVNRLLDVSNLVVATTPAEEAEKNSILAEARTLRAYSYLQLVSFFSTNPADNDALGVILLDFVPPIDAKLPRATNGEIYALMESDLLFAENNLSASALDYKYVTPNLVNAVRARMYLYRKDYVNAKVYALNAIATLPVTTSAVTYNLMWNDLSQGETIFAASRPVAGSWSNIGSLWYFNLTTATGGAFHDMGRNLYNLYDAFPSDVRRINWIDDTAVIDPNYLTNPNFLTSDILPINKYPGKLPQQLRNDLKLFRSSEMVLILAECEVGGPTQNLGQAAAYVQQIRSARGTGQTLPTYTTAQEAWADILLERRKELSYEGHRYIDIKRLATLAGVPGIDRNPTDDIVSSTPLTLSVSDYRFTFPIPQSEVAGNVSIQQNPNY